MTVPLPSVGDTDWLDWAQQVHTASTTGLAGKANTSHTHPVTDLTATGTRDATTYLRGDNTWAVPSVSGGGTYTDEQAQDAAAALLTGGSHSGISFTYDDTGNKVNATVAGALTSSIIDVRSFGATGNGTTNDTTAIQNAINACPAGGTVYFPTPPGGSWRTNVALDVPPNITLRMEHGDTLEYDDAAPSPNCIKPLSTFTAGGNVITLRSKAITGRPTQHVGARLENITIDGTALPVGNQINGFMTIGRVREATFENCTVRRVGRDGFANYKNPSDNLSPLSLRYRGCAADNVGGSGFSFVEVPDTTVIDCNSEGAGVFGFYLAGLMNGIMMGCRAEWSGQYGYYVTSGYWGTGQGSGGLNMLGCLSDRNAKDGVYIDATGGAALQFTGCTFRRDGYLGGNTYAALRANGCNMPVRVSNLCVYPGVHDDGTGNFSPYAGIFSQNSTSVAMSSGDLHAATAPVVNGVGGNLVVAPIVGKATGPTNAPVRTAPTP